MHINQPVIVGVDGSDAAQDALLWAVREAAQHKVPLTIVNATPVLLAFAPGTAVLGTGPAVAPEPEAFEGEHAGRAILAAAASSVEMLANELGLVDVRTELIPAPTIPTLLDLSKDARIMVVGSRGLGAFRRGLLGSVSTALALHAHCPVAVIRSGEIASDAASSGPVVVGVDGSETSTLAIEIAFDQASRRKVELVAVHAWRDNSDLLASVSDWPTTAASEEAVLAESLAGWTEQYPDVLVRRVVVQDRPVKNLVEHSQNAQLIVVGSHGRGGFAGMVLGSTSQALLHSVECPIIIARRQD
jgi:nucleotide-binding universal stress UspA family protein